MKQLKKRKKIAVFSLIRFYPLNTGGKVASFNIINNLSKFYDIDVFFFENRLNKKGLTPKKHFKFINLKETSLNKFSLFFRHFHFFDLFLTLKKFKKINKKYDLIILDFPYLFFITKIISLIYKIPIYLIEYNFEYEYYKQRKNFFYFLLKLYEYFVIMNVNKTFFISFSEFLRAKKHFNNIFYLKLPLTHFNYKKYNHFQKSNKNNLNICFYGKLDEIQNRKAMKIFFDTANKTNNPRIKWFLFGSSNSNIKKIPKKIKYLGFVKNPFDILKEMDIIYVPIKNKSGVKIRILESLFIGKIIFTTKEGKEGLPLELKDLVFEANNQKEFIKKLDNLINKKDLNYVKKKIEKTITKYNSTAIKELTKKI